MKKLLVYSCFLSVIAAVPAFGSQAITGKDGMTLAAPANPLPVELDGPGTGGNVGGFSINASVTPVVQNAPYSAGNCVGGFQAIPVARTSGGSGILSAVNIISKGGNVVPLQFYMFSRNPVNSTCTDKSTFTLAAGDLPYLVATFALTQAAPGGTTMSYAEASGLGRQFVTNANANLYIGIVAGNTMTPATTSDFVINVFASQD